MTRLALFVLTFFLVGCQMVNDQSYQTQGQKRIFDDGYSPLEDKTCTKDKSIDDYHLWPVYTCFNDHGIFFVNAYDFELPVSNEILDERANKYCLREFKNEAKYVGEPNIKYFSGREYVCD